MKILPHHFSHPRFNIDPVKKTFFLNVEENKKGGQKYPCETMTDTEQDIQFQSYNHH